MVMNNIIKLKTISCLSMFASPCLSKGEGSKKGSANLKSSPL
jgi:hypothetical protein